MANQDTIIKPQKYLFDNNRFDDELAEEEEQEQEPPPPVFSEQDLEEAKIKSFESGKKEGLAQAHASRETEIASLLEKIENSFSLLFEQEAQRIFRFESEAVELSKIIIQKLFPLLNEHKGLDEVFKVIEDVIHSHQNTPEIVIEVMPDFVKSIEARIDQTKDNLHIKSTYIVRGNDALALGDCKLSWKDGGGIRDAERLLDDILKQIDKILNDKTLAANGHVRDNKAANKKQMAKNTSQEPNAQMEKHDE